MTTTGTPDPVARIEAKVRARHLPDPDTLREIRVSAGVSTADIGDLLGVTRAAVDHWERGRRRPRGEMAVRYLEVLDALQVLAAEA